jgi:hypothetical protein
MLLPLRDVGAAELQLAIVTILLMPNVQALRNECIIFEDEQLNTKPRGSDEHMMATNIVKSAGYVMSNEARREIICDAAREHSTNGSSHFSVLSYTHIQTRT